MYPCAWRVLWEGQLTISSVIANSLWKLNGFAEFGTIAASISFPYTTILKEKCNQFIPSIHISSQYLQLIHGRNNKAHMPVIGVLIWCICSGVHVITNEPMEIFVLVDTDCLHFLIGEIHTVRIKIPQDHYVLKRIRNCHFRAMIWEQRAILSKS